MLSLNSVATGLGQPSTTKYDWSLEQRKSWRSYLPEELSYRLRIENFCERVSQALYGSSSFTTENSERLGRFQLLTQEFLQLESELSAAGRMYPADLIYTDRLISFSPHITPSAWRPSPPPFVCTFRL